MKYFLKAFALVLVVSSIFTAGCGKGTSDSKSLPQVSMTISLVSPKTAEWPVVVHANGRIEPWQYSIIGSEIGGIRLQETLVEVGDGVKKGQLLAKFDQESIQIDLMQAEADLLDAKANYQLTKRQADNSNRLQGTGALSQENILKSQTNAISAEAKMKLAEAKVQMQRFKLSRVDVRAPDDGVISSRKATVGAVIASGTELYQMIRQNRLEWQANLPGQQLSLVAVGQTVSVNVDENLVVTGKVRKISPVLDASTLTNVVFVDLPKSTPLKVGMFVSGEINLGIEKATYVPESALVYRDGFKYVIEVDSKNRVHFIKVDTNRRIKNQVEIKGDLNADTKLVASGGNFLFEGDLVSIKSEQLIASSKSGN